MAEDRCPTCGSQYWVQGLLACRDRWHDAERKSLAADPPTPAPAWDPDVEQALERVGETIGQAVAPLAQALQDARQGAQVTLDRFVQTYAALAALVTALDAGTVRANWAADQAILDNARALVQRLSPIPDEGTPDGPRVP